MGLSKRSRALVALVVAVAGSLVAGRTGSVVRVLDHAGPATPGEWLDAQRASGEAPTPSQLREAGERARELRARTLAQTTSIQRWSEIGPSNIGGRVTDVASDPTRPGVVYIATASGGVWKTADGGVSLSNTWPSTYPHAIGAIATGSDGTVFVATGEANPGGGSIAYGGSGVYRSTDGGATWQHVGLPDVVSVGRMAIDPGDPKKVFVAATGDLYSSGGARGLYRSLDGGESWDLVLAGSNATTGAVDVVIDPSDPRRMLATMWDRVRVPDLRRYGGPGSGIYRSVDGGTTWNRVVQTIPQNTGRIGVAFSTTGSLAHAIVTTTNGSHEGFYRSLDGGASWNEQPWSQLLSFSQATYGWWFGRVWVDPLVPTHLFAAGVVMAESFDGGATWAVQPTTLAVVHPDQHAMAWDPFVPGRVYLGNDGGFYAGVTGAAGLDWTKALNQPFTQFYSIDVGEQDPTRIVGGAQDNGVLRSYRHVGASPEGWNSYVGGDGLAALIDPQDQARVYGCSQYGACSRSTNGGDRTGGFGSTVSTRRGWFTPVVFDPSDPSILYYGGNRLNRSTNAAQSFTVISPDLAPTNGRDPQYPFGTITTVAVAPSDQQTILVGTDDGRVWSTRNGGTTWTQAPNTTLPKRWVTRVAVDDTDARTAYATFSGYRQGEDAAHVFRTTDGGVTWSNISGDLPNAPVNDIVLVGTRIVVATDLGVFSSADGGVQWSAVGEGLPQVPVSDIRYHDGSGKIFAATYGRGMFSVVFDTPADARATVRPATGFSGLRVI